MEGVSDAMRIELVDKGIKVTCIRPGDVQTNIDQVVIDQEVSCKLYFAYTQLNQKSNLHYTRSIITPKRVTSGRARLISLRLGNTAARNVASVANLATLCRFDRPGYRSPDLMLG